MSEEEAINKPFVVSTPSYADKATLRDQFAMATLSGILSHSKNTCDPEHDAKTAYKFADAMLKERQDNG